MTPTARGMGWSAEPRAVGDGGLVQPFEGRLVADEEATAVVPDWNEGWPEWLSDEGIGLEDED